MKKSDIEALIEAAKEDLQKRLSGDKYRCAIPDDVMPRPMKAKQ